MFCLFFWKWNKNRNKFWDLATFKSFEKPWNVCVVINGNSKMTTREPRGLQWGNRIVLRPAGPVERFKIWLGQQSLSKTRNRTIEIRSDYNLHFARLFIWNTSLRRLFFNTQNNDILISLQSPHAKIKTNSVCIFSVLKNYRTDENLKGWNTSPI